MSMTIFPWLMTITPLRLHVSDVYLIPFDAMSRDASVPALAESTADRPTLINAGTTLSIRPKHPSPTLRPAATMTALVSPSPFLTPTHPHQRHRGL